MIKRGDMNPRWWHHPSIQPYVNVAAYLVAYYSQASSGRWRRIHDLQVEDALLWGRVAAGVIPGTLAVLAAFFLGRRLFGTNVGLISAAILAVAPGVVEVSQYNKPDSLLVLFCTLSVLTTLIYLDRGGGRLAFAGGAVVGLAVAVKYNAAFVLLPFLAAVVFRNGLRLLQTLGPVSRNPRHRRRIHRGLSVLVSRPPALSRSRGSGTLTTTAISGSKARSGSTTGTATRATPSVMARDSLRSSRASSGSRSLSTASTGGSRRFSSIPCSITASTAPRRSSSPETWSRCIRSTPSSRLTESPNRSRSPPRSCIADSERSLPGSSAARSPRSSCSFSGFPYP